MICSGQTWQREKVSEDQRKTKVTKIGDTFITLEEVQESPYWHGGEEATACPGSKEAILIIF